MSPEEWGKIPWYEQEIYMAGFRQEAILKDDNKSSPGPVQSPGSPTTRKLDFTSAGLEDLSGFTTRRAG